jgi:hypothetical protein
MSCTVSNMLTNSLLGWCDKEAYPGNHAQENVSWDFRPQPLYLAGVWRRRVLTVHISHAHSSVRADDVLVLLIAS